MAGKVRSLAMKRGSICVCTHTYTHTHALTLININNEAFLKKKILKPQELIADFWKHIIVSSNLKSATFEPCDLH